MDSSCDMLPMADSPHFDAYPPLEGLPPLAVPAQNMIQVLEFNPNEGEEGAPITVRIHFHSESSEPIHVRLVIGNKAVSTAVRELAGVEYGRWQLDAAAPALDHLATTDPKVLITVQALNAENTILDSVPVGEFSYWECGSSRTKPTQDIKDVMDHSPSLGRRRAATHLPSPSPHYSMPSPSLSDRVPPSKTRSRKRDVQKSIKDKSLMRARHHAPGEVDENLHAHTPVLEMVTPLESLCTGWDDVELKAGRCLVRFQKIQDGRRVILSCESIKQEEYRETDIVISCIFREEAQTCYVTSVDIIYLLERLTNDDFPVEEKNRIRRNLEGLRPTTVSKHKPGSEVFFQRIMDFPDPKPRNIEKDLKVFEWTLLGQALEKIMSKYSIYTSSPTDSTTSLPGESTSDVHSQMHVPSSHVDPALVTTKDGTRTESLLFSSHPYDDHQSPLSPTLPLLPYGLDVIKHESDSSSGSWVSDNSFPSKDPEPAFDIPEYEEPGTDEYGYDSYIIGEGDPEMISMSF
ncbi:hypothetical protein DFH07DRAFT_863557 [Mycena maculata]|uniref:DUF7082 domain-containing protein n=1 Tax=Mycena maculata TaxID=230809 RepID=A0AAD7H7B4_9AGAR|nr:hypothetical protein DFH07DRAFT_863557 [Mycena maculata]